MKKIIICMLFFVCLFSNSQAQWTNVTPNLNTGEEIRSFLPLTDANYLLTNQRVLKNTPNTQNWQTLMSANLKGIRADANNCVVWNNNTLYHGSELQYSMTLPGINAGNITDIQSVNGNYKVISVDGHSHGFAATVNIYEGSDALTFISSADYTFMTPSSVKWVSEDTYVLNHTTPTAGSGWTALYKVPAAGNHIQIIEVTGRYCSISGNGNTIWGVTQATSYIPAYSEQIDLFTINLENISSQSYEWYHHQDPSFYNGAVTRGIRYLPNAMARTESNRFICVGAYDAKLGTSIRSYNLANNIFSPLQGPSNDDLIGINKAENGYFVYSINGIWINQTLSAVENNTKTINNYQLQQNYPNPFNPVTKINFTLPKSGNVSLIIFDIAGKEITTIVNETKAAGEYSVDFNAANLSSGTYFYRLETNDFVATKKMILVK